MDELRPPLLPVSDDDHGPWVIVVSTILLILAIMATVVTLISRIRVLGKIAVSDFVLTLGCIMFILQTVCINVASFNGIGKSRFILAEASFESYQQAFYASQLLSVAVLACSKAAVAFLVLSLKPFEKIRLACQMALGLIGAWAIASLVALGLQCERPDPWRFGPNRCVNQQALYLILALTHMLLDIIVICLPVTLLWQIQIMQQRRYYISALFVIRILVPVLTVPAIWSMQPYFHAKPLDQPWHALMPAIWLQLVQSVSLLCTCIPTLKRALADLQTGMMGGAVSNFFEVSVSGGHSNPEELGSKSRSGIGRRLGSTIPSISLETLSTEFRRSTPRVERTLSQKGLREDVIFHSIDWDVRYEKTGPRAFPMIQDQESVQYDDLSIHYQLGP